MTEARAFPIQTLMLIDDSEIDQMIYLRIAKKSGLVGDMVQFLDATEALRYLEQGDQSKPDLILLDINMPGMDGFEFLREATKLLGASLCPIVVMLTTSLNPEDEVRARAFDVVKDFLNKPLTAEQLASLSQLVRRQAA